MFKDVQQDDLKNLEWLSKKVIKIPSTISRSAKVGWDFL